MCVFDWRAKTIAVGAPFCVAWQKCCLPTTPWEFPNKAKHVRHAICQVLKHGDEPSGCESSCPCYCSQIEGLGLHVVNITRYVVRITKHLYHRIEIIEIKSNRVAYESKSNRIAWHMNRNQIESRGIWIVTPLIPIKHKTLSYYQFKKQYWWIYCSSVLIAGVNEWPNESY